MSTSLRFRLRRSSFLRASITSKSETNSPLIFNKLNYCWQELYIGIDHLIFYLFPPPESEPLSSARSAFFFDWSSGPASLSSPESPNASLSTFFSSSFPFVPPSSSLESPAGREMRDFLDFLELPAFSPSDSLSLCLRLRAEPPLLTLEADEDREPREETDLDLEPKNTIQYLLCH